MKMKFIALAIIASASSGVAQAHLTAADQDLIKAYQQANPDVPSYIINNMKADYMKDLQAVRDYMTGVTWYGNSTLHTLPPLDSVHSNPQVVPLSVKRDQAEGDARVADNQARTTGQTQALHAAILDQKFGQVKGNIQRTAPQVTALQQAEGDARVVSNQQRTLAQSQALTDSKANAVDVTKNNTLNTLSASVTRAEAKGEEAQSRADIAYAHAEENENAIQATNHRVAENSANIAAEEEQITTLKSDTDKNFSKMNNRIDENRQRASAAISGVAAMANIPQVIQGQTFSIGAGVGSTDGESAAAVGFSARAGDRVIVKASVSDDTQQNFVIGGGVSYGW